MVPMEKMIARLQQGDLSEICIDQIPPTDWSVLVEASFQSGSLVETISIKNVTMSGGPAQSGVLAILRQHATTLRHVVLEGLQLSATSARVYAEVLPWSTTLESLSLANNAKLGPRGIKMWCEYLKQAKALRQLNCENCGMGHFGAQALGQVLPRSLESLNLSRNKLGADGIWKMASRFAVLNELQVLDLSHNQMGDDGCLELARNLHKTTTNNDAVSALRVLNLSGNAVGDHGMVELIASLPDLPNLRELDLSTNQLGNASAKQLGSVLRMCPSLQVLDLSHNQIGDRGCVQIVEALLPQEYEEGESESDDEEDFDENDNFNEAVENIVAVFPGQEREGGKESCLQELRLDHNAIGDEGAGALVEYLDQINSLKNVSLQGNLISDARIRILQMLLKHRTSIVNSPSKRASLLTETTVTPETTERDEEILPTLDYEKSKDQNKETGINESKLIEQGRQLLLSTASSDDEGISNLPMAYILHLTGNWGRTVCQHGGAFGPLLRAVDEESGVDNPLWLVRRLNLSLPGKMEAVRKAVVAEMPSIQHPSIAPLSAIATNNGCYAFMYEIPDITAINLRKCLTDPQHRGSLTWQARAHIASSIASALEFLHSDSPGRKAAVHGDLNPDSIYVTPDYQHVYLLDAGLSRLLATDRSRFAGGDIVYGTRAYRCPRYERGSASYDSSSDCFALGILLAEIMTSRLQRSKDKKSNLSYDVYYDCVLARGSLRADPAVGPVSRNLLQTWGQITLACMSPMPFQRPTASTVAQILKNLSTQKL